MGYIFMIPKLDCFVMLPSSKHSDRSSGKRRHTKSRSSPSSYTDGQQREKKWLMLQVQLISGRRVRNIAQNHHHDNSLVRTPGSQLPFDESFPVQIKTIVVSSSLRTCFKNNTTDQDFEEPANIMLARRKITQTKIERQLMASSSIFLNSCTEQPWHTGSMIFHDCGRFRSL